MKVIDASALSAILFHEPDADRVMTWIADDPLVAPTLVGYEVANTCWKKLLRHPDQQRELLAAYGLFSKMELEERGVPLEEVLRLAQAERLTVYDASYLWLARSLGAELVSLDHRLLRATGQIAG